MLAPRVCKIADLAVNSNEAPVEIYLSCHGTVQLRTCVDQGQVVEWVARIMAWVCGQEGLYGCGA